MIIVSLFIQAMRDAFIARNSGKLAGDLVQRWVDAFNSHDVGKLTALYASKSFLHATFDGRPLEKPEERAAYFKGLMEQKKATVTIDSQKLETDRDGVRVYNGGYTFRCEENGKTVSIPARFSFVFEEAGYGIWKITTQHSSVMPQVTEPRAPRLAVSNPAQDLKAA